MKKNTFSGQEIIKLASLHIFSATEQAKFFRNHAKSTYAFSQLFQTAMCFKTNFPCTRFVLSLECREFSAGANLGLLCAIGHGATFGNECSIGSKSMAAPHLKLPLYLSILARLDNRQSPCSSV